MAKLCPLYFLTKEAKIYNGKISLYIRQMALAKTNLYVQKMKADSCISPCEKPILLLSLKTSKGK